MLSPRLASIVGFSLGLALSAPVPAQCELQKLLASDGQALDIFGKSVAVRGDRAFVGQTGLSGIEGGAIYAFRHVPSGWAQVQILTGSDTAPSDDFGFSAAMSDATAVVGAISHSHAGIGSSGAVYVFELDQGVWHEVQELLAVGPLAGDLFGRAVGIDGDVLVASAIGRDTFGMQNAGVAYVFERRPNGWIRTAELTPSDLAANDTFGDDVAVSGTTIVVGKSRDSGYRGAAYVFENAGQGWVQTAKLTASDGVANDDFGWSVDIDGDRVLVGSVNAAAAGAAYLYERTPSGWAERAKLSPADAPPSGDFGYEVSLRGDTALVGMPGVGGPSRPGAVYAYRRDGFAWPFVARLAPGDGGPADAFGSFLATDGETLFAGAAWDDDLGYLAGSAYVFALPEFATPYGFCTGAGICGNGDPVGGCANSTGRGARLVACGSGSLAIDDFALAADRMPPLRPIVFYRGGSAAQTPFGDGFRSVAAGNLGLRRFAPTVTAANGTASLGPGILAASGVAPGETWFFQAWFADPSGPCGAGSNTSNAVRAVSGT